MFLTYMDFILFLLALYFRRKLVEHQEMMNIKKYRRLELYFYRVVL